MKQRKKGGASKQGEKYVRRSRGRKEEGKYFLIFFLG
jgi:hypothetical protein